MRRRRAGRGRSTRRTDRYPSAAVDAPSTGLSDGSRQQSGPWFLEQPAPGWLWCRSLGGSFGWVSADAVELIEEIPPVTRYQRSFRRRLSMSLRTINVSPSIT